MQWVTPRASSPFVSSSGDGYYGIIANPITEEFRAWHIPAVWAQREQIGEVYTTLAAAQQVCEDHLKAQIQRRVDNSSNRS